MLTSRRAEPTRFDVQVTAQKVRDEGGNRLQDPKVCFRVEFPDGTAGDTARDRLAEAVQRAHDRLCTVSRTIELPNVVDMSMVLRDAGRRRVSGRLTAPRGQQML